MLVIPSSFSSALKTFSSTFSAIGESVKIGFCSRFSVCSLAATVSCMALSALAGAIIAELMILYSSFVFVVPAVPATTMLSSGTRMTIWPYAPVDV